MSKQSLKKPQPLPDKTDTSSLAPREHGPSPFGSRLAKLNADGSWELVGAPTLEQLTKHAQRFGCGQVAETAVDVGYDAERLAQLIAVLDTIAVTHSRDHKHITWWKGYAHAKASPADRARRLLGLKKCPDCNDRKTKRESCETCNATGWVPKVAGDSGYTESEEDVAIEEEPTSEEE